MGNAGGFGSAAGMIDDVLGNAYLIVKHVYDNLTALADVAARTDAIDQIKENLDLAETAVLAQNLAVVLAGVTNFRETFDECLADFIPGQYFTTAATDELRLYKRIEGAPGYLDMGDIVAPVSRGLLAGLTGAAMIGTSTAEVNVQEALNARPTTDELADVTGAELIGTTDPDMNVQEALNARPTNEDLADDSAASLIGSNSGLGANIDDALTNLIPTDQTTGNLQSLVSTINTVGKYKGKQAFNTTAQHMVMALGPEDNDGWIAVDGSITYTPA
jgi:hypothetical protein